MKSRGLLDRIREFMHRRRQARSAELARKRALRETIEHVVDEINPRIRAVSRYREKLAKPVERALAHAREIVDSLPAPVAVNRDSWRTDPRVRSFFSGVDALKRVYSSSGEIRDYFDQHLSVEHNDCYALLVMERKERTFLGIEQQGGMLRKDVQQTSVSFTDPRVVKPAVSESALRKELEGRALEVLVAYTLECITDLEATHSALEEQRRRIEMQLRVARVKTASLSMLIDSEDKVDMNLDKLRNQQEQTGRQLEESRTRLSGLDDYIERITEVLGDPERHLRSSVVSMRLNKMNIKQDMDQTDAGDKIELTEISLGDQVKHIVVITRFSRSDLLPKTDFL